MASTTTLVDRDKKFFAQALFCDQLRGSDSTGIFAVPKKDYDQVDILKKRYPASDFMQLNAPARLLNNVSDFRLMVGHNRAATKGVIRDANAHPFQYKNITLVHNGTLRDYHALPSYNNYDVDSKILTRAIQEIGIEECVNKVSGAYTLVWHDSEDNSLHFLRNSQRPLAIGATKNRKEIYFASELHMLGWLAVRNNISLEELDELPENSHVTIDLEGKEFEPHVTEVKRKFKVAKTKHNTTNVHNLPDKNKQKVDTHLLPDVDDCIEAYIHTFRTYKNLTCGCAEGVTKDKPYLPVELHNQSGEKDFCPGLYRFRVVSVSWSELAQDYIVRGVGAGLLEEKEKCSKKSEGSKKSATSEETQEPAKRECLRLPSQTEKSLSNKFVVVKNSIAETLEGLLPGCWDNDFDVDEATGDILNVVGPHGSKVSEAEFDKLTRHGCSCCQRDFDIVDAPFITWEDRSTPICDDCEAERDNFRRIYGSNDGYIPLKHGSGETLQ